MLDGSVFLHKLCEWIIHHMKKMNGYQRMNQARL